MLGMHKNTIGVFYVWCSYLYETREREVQVRHVPKQRWMENENHSKRQDFRSAPRRKKKFPIWDTNANLLDWRSPQFGGTKSVACPSFRCTSTQILDRLTLYCNKLSWQDKSAFSSILLLVGPNVTKYFFQEINLWSIFLVHTPLSASPLQVFILYNVYFLLIYLSTTTWNI